MPNAGQGPNPTTPRITLSTEFKLIFLTVVVLTVISLGVDIYLALFVAPSPQTLRLSETVSTAFKMGFGAIIGLIGGKQL